MSTLIYTRGLPASGKSTWAKQWVAENVGGRARVNKDDLRAMAHNSEFVPGVTEQRINTVRDSTILGLLTAGVDVVCDDTNLPQRVARGLHQLAAKAGADVHVRDFTTVPLQVCLERDAARPQSVGEKVIRGMHERYLKGRTLPLPAPAAAPRGKLLVPYTPPTGRLTKAFLLDVDGTAALMGDRSPYDLSRVGEDLPNKPVLDVARSMYWRGWDCIVLSGRDEICRDETVRWLRYHLGIPIHGPFMRAAGDRRADWIVKAELFDEHVRDHFIVDFVLDDRDQVVQMWRRLGLTTFQVAEGNF
ncbi:AAA family ATPase [Nonomuraea sp. NPDC050202]|uniref:phosphatase domain-containing protein n=1 Tax=Nonomuraea sp. NPDC050202 TaxID=3155035 RepID=UPI0033C46B1E